MALRIAIVRLLHFGTGSAGRASLASHYSTSVTVWRVASFSFFGPIRNAVSKLFAYVFCYFVLRMFQVNETVLKSLLTYPDQDYFFVTDFSKFSVILDRLINQACRQVSQQCSTTPLPTTSTTSVGNILSILLQNSWRLSSSIRLANICFNCQLQWGISCVSDDNRGACVLRVCSDNDTEKYVSYNSRERHR